MAIPNDYIDKITNKDSGESRIISPAADKVRVDNENFEGTDLDEVLDEVAHAIDEAGSGDGTVTGVKVGSTTYEPTDGVVDITQAIPDTSGKANKSEMSVVAGTGTNADKTTITLKEGTSATVLTQHQNISGKVDKNGTDSLMTAAEHTKLAGIAAGAQVNVINSISVNGTAQTPTNGNVNIVMPTMTMDDVPTAGSNNAVKSGGIKTAIDNATPTIDPTTKKWIVGGQLTNIVAEGQDGQDGNSGVASADGIESVNNLNGGTTDTAEKVYVLGANQGKRLKDQIDYVYARLQAVYAAIGNIAFWDGKPAAATILPNLDWGNPKHTVTLDLDLTNAVVKHNGVSKSDLDTIQVEEYATLTLTVEAESGKELTSVTSQVGTVSQDLSTVTLVMGQSNVTLDITAVASSAKAINYGTMKNCSVTQGAPTRIDDGSTATIVFSADSGYTLEEGGIEVSGASIVSFNNNTLVIGNATEAVAISAIAYASTIKFIKNRWINWTSNPMNPYPSNLPNNDYVSKFAVSEFIHVQKPSSAVGTTPTWSIHYGYVAKNTTRPICVAFYKYENGEYAYLANKTTNSTNWEYTGDFTKNEVLDAYNAGNLFVRVMFGFSDDAFVNTCVLTVKDANMSAVQNVYKPNNDYSLLTENEWPSSIDVLIDESNGNV